MFQYIKDTYHYRKKLADLFHWHGKRPIMLNQGCWYPIETAPKDSTQLLLKLKSPLTVEKGYWESFAYNNKTGKQGMWRCPALTMTVEPIYWMLIPSDNEIEVRGSND